jgi:hypothetical protein
VIIVDAVIAGARDAASLARVIRAVPELVRDVYVVGEAGLASAVTSAGARLLSSPDPGLGAQLERARVHLCALSRPPDVAVLLSPDGSDDPSELTLLLAPIRSGGADLVIGSRALGTREPGASGCGLGQRVAALLIGLVYQQRYRDLSPFRAIRVPAWVALGLRERGFGYFVEMQIKAARAGLRVVEVPVHARRAVRPPWRARLAALVGTSWRFSYLLVRYATAR